MPNEARTFLEGSLRWAAASASGNGWVTGTSPATALVGLVRVGVSQASAQNFVAIKERGKVNHWKFQGDEPVELQFEFIEALSANNPAQYVATAGGASVKMMHFELKSKAPEDTSALWRQFHHAVLMSDGWKEAEDGNVKTQTWQALSMNGPTGSGYLSTALQ